VLARITASSLFGKTSTRLFASRSARLKVLISHEDRHDAEVFQNGLDERDLDFKRMLLMVCLRNPFHLRMGGEQLLCNVTVHRRNTERGLVARILAHGNPSETNRWLGPIRMTILGEAVWSSL